MPELYPACAFPINAIGIPVRIGVSVCFDKCFQLV